jgi:hypothetical protein
MRNYNYFSPFSFARSKFRVGLSLIPHPLISWTLQTFLLLRDLWCIFVLDSLFSSVFHMWAVHCLVHSDIYFTVYNILLRMFSLDLYAAWELPAASRRTLFYRYILSPHLRSGHDGRIHCYFMKCLIENPLKCFYRNYFCFIRKVITHTDCLFQTSRQDLLLLYEVLNWTSFETFLSFFYFLLKIISLTDFHSWIYSYWILQWSNLFKKLLC